MAIAFVKTAADLVPVKVKTGYIIDNNEIGDVQWTLDKDDLRALTKADLLDLARREDGLVRNEAKTKQRAKMTKSQLVDYISEHWDEIVSKTKSAKMMRSGARGAMRQIGEEVGALYGEKPASGYKPMAHVSLTKVEEKGQGLLHGGQLDGHRLWLLQGCRWR